MLLAAEQGGEGIERVPGDGAAVVDREVAERFDEMRFAGPARAAHNQDFGAVDPFERLQRLLGWFRDRRRVVLPGIEGLAGGQSGRAPAHVDRRPVATGGVGQQPEHAIPRRGPQAHEMLTTPEAFTHRGH
jgi:hypothetical protein